jgi:hypothetical protein
VAEAPAPPLRQGPPLQQLHTQLGVLLTIARLHCSGTARIASGWKVFSYQYCTASVCMPSLGNLTFYRLMSLLPLLLMKNVLRHGHEKNESSSAHCSSFFTSVPLLIDM